MLIFSTILLLLSNAVNLRRESSVLYSRISMLILIHAILILYVNLNINFLSKGIIMYGGLMHIKSYTYIFIIFILMLSVFIINITSVLPNQFKQRYITQNAMIFPLITDDNSSNAHFYLNHKSLLAYDKNINILLNNLKKNFIYYTNNIISNKMADQFRIIEYPLIILFCLTGAIFLISSSDIISIFLSIELQSYGLYLISSIYRNSESSISAGLTYFLLGGLSSCIILLGLSLLYINTGNTSLENIYMINSISNAFASNLIHENIPLDNLWVYKHVYMQYTYMQIPLAVISIGLLFKIASAPFHFWSPDVYDAIPTIVTTFVAIIAKISILILFIQLILYTEDNLISFSWSNIIILSSVLSLLIGSILGLVQSRIKRLYAYSTISHLGFILLALSINNLEATRAFFFYIIQYSISNLNLFIILICIGYSLYIYVNNNNNVTLKDDKYSPIQFISQLKGFHFINPILSLSLIITLFSFVGVPPLIGFFGKQMVLSAALDNGYIFTTLVAIITSVISAVYYLVLVKVIYFEDKNYNLNNLFFKYLTDVFQKLINDTIKLEYSLSRKIMDRHWDEIQKSLKSSDKMGERAFPSYYDEITKRIESFSLKEQERLLAKKNNPEFWVKDFKQYKKNSFFNILLREKFSFNNIILSSFLSFSIAIFTLFILSFILFDQELIRLIYIII